MQSHPIHFTGNTGGVVLSVCGHNSLLMTREATRSIYTLHLLIMQPHHPRDFSAIPFGLDMSIMFESSAALSCLIITSVLQVEVVG